MSRWENFKDNLAHVDSDWHGWAALLLAALGVAGVIGVIVGVVGAAAAVITANPGVSLGALIGVSAVLLVIAILAATS